MRIAVTSRSASVLRTLEAIILQSGHTLAKDPTEAEFVIEDTLHPASVASVPASKRASLQLVAAGAPAQEHAVPCPLRPERLIQRLTMLESTQAVALGGGWSLDGLTRTLQGAQGASCALTEKECDLLKHLAQAHPSPISRDRLLEKVWGVHGDIDTHTLETHIYRLRSKLNELTPHPCDILTQGGAYALVFGPEPG